MVVEVPEISPAPPELPQPEVRQPIPSDGRRLYFSERLLPNLQAFKGSGILPLLSPSPEENAELAKKEPASAKEETAEARRAAAFSALLNRSPALDSPGNYPRDGCQMIM
jgi:hypothetical protein